ncbi:MAG: helix-turn-helix transcriptional regulator [Candidatus Aenigmatarchaeota archaeon]|nr:MAG: helix-turn-helix transcriptional regulator [Candidatus Aenigmarchaeota archaeon]
MHLKRLEKLNTRDCLWMYVLGILNKKPTHAYVIRKEIEKKFDFRPGTVTAYRVLYRLREAGLVKKTKEDRRVVYNITPKGKQDLKKAINFYKQRIKLLEK